MERFSHIDLTLFQCIGKQYAHNCYLQIWAETGIFSLLSFLGFLWLLLRQGIRAFKKTQNYIVLGLTCGLFGYLVHASLDVHFYSLQLAVLFWMWAGILSAASTIALKREVADGK
jgi:O-antigen ligase